MTPGFPQWAARWREGLSAYRWREALPAVAFGLAMAVVPLAVLRSPLVALLAATSVGCVVLATVPRFGSADLAAVLLASAAAAAGVLTSAPYAGLGAGATAVLGYGYLAVTDLGRCPPTASWASGVVLTALAASAVCAGVLLAAAAAPRLPAWAAGLGVGALVLVGVAVTSLQARQRPP